VQRLAEDTKSSGSPRIEIENGLGRGDWKGDISESRRYHWQG